MKYTTKQVLRIMTRQLGLKVKYVNYFPHGTHGRLLSSEKRILVNAHEPRYEHVFTILHEIAHYTIHVLNANRLPLPWFLKRPWKSNHIARMVSVLRRHIRFKFSKHNSKERQADLWAFIAFFSVANCAETFDELIAFIAHHPEKSGTYFLAALAVTNNRINTRIRNIPHKLLFPFRPLPKS